MNAQARIKALADRREEIHKAHPGELPPDAQRDYDKAGAELRSLQAAERRQAEIDAEARSLPGQSLSDDRHFEAFRAEVRCTAAIRAAMGATDHEAGKAREASAEIARRTGRGPQQGGVLWMPHRELRAVTTGQQGTTPNGAGLVPTIQRGDLFVDVLRANSITARLGARYIADLVGTVAIPKKTASATVYWVGEGQQITESDPAFGQIVMTPKTAGGITEYSRNLVLQSSPDVDALVQDDLAKSLAVALDAVALAGDGAGYKPKGIATVSPNVSYAKAGIAYPDITGALATLETANVNPNGWAVGPTVRSTLMRTSSTSVDFIMPALTSPIAGLPVAQTGSMASGQLIVGDWSDLIVGQWSGIEILVNPYASGSYEAGNVKVRALLSCDIAVRHPESFVVMNKATS